MKAKSTVLVTGGSSGIGLEIVRQYTKRGHAVIVLDLNLPSSHSNLSKNSDSGGCFVVKCDLSKLESFDAICRKVNQIVLQNKIPFPRVFVHAAGIREITPALKLSLKTFCQVQDVNVTSGFLLTQFLAKRWINRKQNGSVVFISSVSGMMAEPNRAAYVTSKHALLGLTKQLAMEFGERGIRVNAVSPGVIETPLTKDYFRNSKLVRLIKKNHAMARWGQVDEVASVVRFVASKKASFMTGANIVVDGGWTAGKIL
jgi:NAD(P)-dependent dehydrogenase (short-subunit alcohol dehydrogenase family)